MSIKRIDPKEAKITLLTEEQAEKLPIEMLKRGCRWWLRSPTNSRYAANVSRDGWSNYCRNVNDAYIGVVPAFIIDNLNTDFGNKVYVDKLQCTVVGENLVLADEVVCQHRYDENSSDWETSELKAFIESDEFAEKYVLDHAECELQAECENLESETLRQATADALSLIDSQKAEIKNLEYCYTQARRYNDSLAEGCNEMCKRETKSEAIKEFAERLKTHRRKMSSSDFGGDFWDTAVLESDIDSLVKEMTENRRIDYEN